MLFPIRYHIHTYSFLFKLLNICLSSMSCERVNMKAWHVSMIGFRLFKKNHLIIVCLCSSVIWINCIVTVEWWWMGACHSWRNVANHRLLTTFRVSPFVHPSVRDSWVLFVDFGTLELTYIVQILGIIPIAVRYLVKSEATL